MALYGERRRRTALVHLDRAGGMYRRSDVLSMLETTVGLRKVEAVGQLQNTITARGKWCSGMRRQRSTHIMHVVHVKQHRATIVDFHRQTRRLRVVRVPTCVPNEFLSAKLKQFDVSVKHITHEINAADGLMSNVRIATIECKSVISGVCGGRGGLAPKRRSTCIVKMYAKCTVHILCVSESEIHLCSVMLIIMYIVYRVLSLSVNPMLRTYINLSKQHRLCLRKKLPRDM